MGLRLGKQFVDCTHANTGTAVDVLGRHTLSYRRSEGRHHRHAAINDIIRRSLTNFLDQMGRDQMG